MVLIAWVGWPPRRAAYQISLRVIRLSYCLLEVSQLLHGLEYGRAHMLSMQMRCRVFFGHEGPLLILADPCISQTAILTTQANCRLHYREVSLTHLLGSYSGPAIATHYNLVIWPETITWLLRLLYRSPPRQQPAQSWHPVLTMCQRNKLVPRRWPVRASTAWTSCPQSTYLPRYAAPLSLLTVNINNSTDAHHRPCCLHTARGPCTRHPAPHPACCTGPGRCSCHTPEATSSACNSLANPAWYPSCTSGCL